MKLGSECIRYCGTMLACSVSEAGQQKGVIEVELGEKGEVQTRILPLHPLRQIKVLRGTAEEILAQACEDYVSVTLTDTPDFDTQDRLRGCIPISAGNPQRYVITAGLCRSVAGSGKTGSV